VLPSSARRWIIASSIEAGYKVLINSLCEYRSVIITSNKDFTNWGEFFHDDNVAVLIVDCLIHHSHIFMLGGESYRLKQKLGS